MPSLPAPLAQDFHGAVRERDGAATRHQEKPRCRCAARAGTPLAYPASPPVPSRAQFRRRRQEPGCRRTRLTRSVALAARATIASLEREVKALGAPAPATATRPAAGAGAVATLQELQVRAA